MIARSPVRRKRPGPPRKGRRVDKKYLAWLHTQPCIVSGLRAATGVYITAHHVRRLGEPKDDRRTVPLLERYHLHDAGQWSVERLGRKNFETVFQVDFEAEILRLNRLYEEEHGGRKR